jgi:ABC-type molybdate transport system permease subunit
MAPSEAGDGRDESPDEKLDRNWDELLQELRITQTGLQLLSGFLLTLPFTQVFSGLDHAQKVLYLSLVVLSGVAVGTNLTPVMVHRRVFGDHVKDRVVELGHVLSQVVIGAVALLIAGTATLIFSVVAGWAAGLVVGLVLVAVLTALLVGVPTMLTPRHDPPSG